MLNTASFHFKTTLQAQRSTSKTIRADYYPEWKGLRLCNSLTPSHTNLHFRACDFHCTELAGVTWACQERLCGFSHLSPRVSIPWWCRDGWVHWNPISNFRNWKPSWVKREAPELLGGHMQNFPALVWHLQRDLLHGCHVPLALLGTEAWGGVMNAVLVRSEDQCRWLSAEADIGGGKVEDESGITKDKW